MLARHGWDAAGQGLVGAPPVTVVVGAEVHMAVRKALGLVGLGRDRAVAMRISVSGWSTTEEDIDVSLAAIRACAAR